MLEKVKIVKEQPEQQRYRSASLADLARALKKLKGAKLWACLDHKTIDNYEHLLWCRLL